MLFDGVPRLIIGGPQLIIDRSYPLDEKKESGLAPSGDNATLMMLNKKRKGGEKKEPVTNCYFFISRVYTEECIVT